MNEFCLLMFVSYYNVIGLIYNNWLMVTLIESLLKIPKI